MKIAVIGRRLLTRSCLRKFLKKNSLLNNLRLSLNSKPQKNLKDADIIISMAWGKSIWGESIND